MGPWYGPLASLKGSGAWAPMLKVMMELQSFYEDSDKGPIRGGPWYLQLGYTSTYESNTT